MSDGNVTIDLNVNKIYKDKKARLMKAQIKLDVEIAKDSNFYSPEDTGDLKRSAIQSRTFGKGYLIWDMLYAKYKYYIDNNKSKLKNPNARYKWFEFAKAENTKKWEKVANDEYNK